MNTVSTCNYLAMAQLLLNNWEDFLIKQIPSPLNADRNDVRVLSLTSLRGTQ